MAILKFVKDGSFNFENRYWYICDMNKTDESMIFTMNTYRPLVDIPLLYRLHQEYKPTCEYKHIVVALQKEEAVDLYQALLCFKEVGRVLNRNGRFPLVAAVHYKGSDNSGVGIHCHYLICKINYDGERYRQGYHINTYKNTINRILQKFGFNPVISYSTSDKVIE